MSKEFSFLNKGTCSKQTNFVLNDDHTLRAWKSSAAAMAT